MANSDWLGKDRTYSRREVVGRFYDYLTQGVFPRRNPEGTFEYPCAWIHSASIDNECYRCEVEMYVFLRSSGMHTPRTAVGPVEMRSVLTAYGIAVPEELNLLAEEYLQAREAR